MQEEIDIGDGKYFGELDEEGKMHGRGKATWDTGETYEGEWEYDNMHGRGRYNWADGDYYVGEYVDGLQHGQGEHKEGDSMYRGEWQRDERHGRGVLTNGDGTVYEGQWYHNERHGQGSQRDPNGEVYEGEFVHGVRQGRGVLKNPSGDIYDGEFVHGQPNGEGVYRWPDGTTFKGQFLNGMKHGQGCERLPDGSWVAGTWNYGDHDGKQAVHYISKKELEDAAEENIAKLSLETLIRQPSGTLSSLSASPTSTVDGSLSQPATLNSQGASRVPTVIASPHAKTPAAAQPESQQPTVHSHNTVTHHAVSSSPAAVPPPPPPAPVVRPISEQDLEGWTAHKMLGKGSFGAVYEVALPCGRIVCVKVIELGSISDGTELEKLRGEIALMKRLHHTNIVQYFGCLEDKAKKTINIFMELVSGGTLNTFVKKFKTIPIPTIRNWTHQMVLGVKYLHDCGIVHRDIKGDNVLVSMDGVLKLADFGCSKSIDDVCSKTHGCQTMVGTPYWMAPEVIKCDAGGYGMKSDIWSIGCTVVEMVTGKPPWPECNSMWAAVYKIANSTGLPTEIPKDLDPQLMSFLEVCFERDPSRRPSAAELLQHPFMQGA
jgi:hypothetical protein